MYIYKGKITCEYREKGKKRIKRFIALITVHD